MSDRNSNRLDRSAASRRRFLGQVGRGAVSGSVAWSLLDQRTAAAGAPRSGKVAHRTLGKTGLDVSEVGFGGHSWAYKKVPTREGGLRE